MSENGPHPASLEVPKLLQQCRFERTRRGGPGGQHRNKTETAVVVNHIPTGVSAEASERRSQADNRAVAIHRLRVRLAVEVRRPQAGAPSDLWRRRSTQGRVVVAAEHADYPGLLAEALDVLAGTDFVLPVASTYLGVSSTSLLRLLEQEKQATQWVNKEREARGMVFLRF